MMRKPVAAQSQDFASFVSRVKGLLLKLRSRLDWVNLIAGAVLGWLIGLPFYLSDQNAAEVQHAEDQAVIEQLRADNARQFQLVLRAVEQVGGNATFVRDASGRIIDIRIDLAASGHANATAAASLDLQPQGK